MSIVTKSGDGGLTSLFSGERVPKDDAHIEALGAIDELLCALALAVHFCACEDTKDALGRMEEVLDSAMAEIASTEGEKRCGVRSEDVAMVEAGIAEIEQRLPVSGFVAPGQTKGAAFLDLARSIARRAERRVHSLDRSQSISFELRRYLNRISDYLFMLARSEEAASGKGPVYRSPSRSAES